MDKQRCSEYATRVTQANRSELTVIILEALSESISDAKKSLLDEDMIGMKREIDRARGFLTELMGSLDFHYEIAYYLRYIYIYAYQELCSAKATKESECLEHSKSVIDKLIPSFREVAKQDDSEAVMQNVETVYAGLTYGKGYLNESVDVGNGTNRGFQA